LAPHSKVKILVQVVLEQSVQIISAYDEEGTGGWRKLRIE
jgi:hypothetical protein